MGVGGRKDYFQLRELGDVLRRLLVGGGGGRTLKAGDGCGGEGEQQGQCRESKASSDWFHKA